MSQALYVAGFRGANLYFRHGQVFASLFLFLESLQFIRNRSLNLWVSKSQETTQWHSNGLLTMLNMPLVALSIVVGQTLRPALPWQRRGQFVWICRWSVDQPITTTGNPSLFGHFSKQANLFHVRTANFFYRRPCADLWSNQSLCDIRGEVNCSYVQSSSSKFGSCIGIRLFSEKCSASIGIAMKRSLHHYSSHIITFYAVINIVVEALKYFIKLPVM